MSPSVSVIICTHNPRPDYLRRTLAALQAQTLPPARWELLLVDNASVPALAASWDLDWHPRCRHVREPELGLTPARLCGIHEAAGELIVFVDDDNVLASDYLAAAVELFAGRPDLGAASGRLLPEYETPPPAWFRPHESWIAVRRLEADAWSNFFDSRSEPCGAGMCLRRDVALQYAARAAGDPAQRLLGRRGQSLLGGEDVAITKAALALGYSMGQFTTLNATHLIPSRRVTEDYLFQLYRNLQASGQLLAWAHDQAPLRRADWRVRAKAALRFLRGGRVERRLVIEEFRARALAGRLIREAAPAPPAVGAGTLQKT